MEGTATEAEPAAPDHEGSSLLAVAPVLTVMLIAAMASRLIQDSSFLWHIRAGALQLGATEVISTDPFSFTRFGDQWRTQSWLVELLYAWLESTFPSYAWVNWMVFVVGALLVGFLVLGLYHAVRSPIAITIALVPVLWLVAPFLRPRPVVFAFLLLAMLVVAIQHPERLAWTIVPIIWLWAAAHGSWVIGGALVVLEWLRTFDRRIFKAGLVALAATLITAHGIGTWDVLANFAGSGEALDLLIEWQTPNFTSLLQGPFVLLIIGILLASMRGRIVPRDLIVIVPFLLLGMSANRSVVPAVIVLAPWAALALPEIRVPKRRHPRAIVVGVWALVGVLALIPMVVRPLGAFDPVRFPSVAMLDAMEGRNPFYSDVVGGYLIFAQGPDTLVYIDDRAELYGGEFFQQYLDTTSGAYETTFAEYGFDAAVSRSDWLLTERLEADGWVRVVEDEDFILLFPPGE